MAPRISESTRRTMGLSAGSDCQVDRLALVVGHELQAQRLAGLLEQDLAAAVPAQHVLDALARGATTASMGRASRNSSSSTLSEVLEAAEGQHQPRALAADGHAAEAHQQLERHLRPQAGVVGRPVERLERQVERVGLAARLLPVGVGGGRLARSGMRRPHGRAGHVRS